MTEIKTFKMDGKLEDIDDLYNYLMKNNELIGKYCGVRIQKELKERPFCITAIEKETNKKILFYFSKETLPENIGELVVLAAAFEVKIMVFLVSRINVTLLEPMNWLHNICNEDIKFILGEVSYKPRLKSV